jgi:hypothetical protein
MYVWEMVCNYHIRTVDTLEGSEQFNISEL